MTGILCIGVTLHWNCAKRELIFLVPEFYPSLLRKFKHQLSSKHQCSPLPAPHVARIKHVQLSPDPDSSPKLDDKRMKFTQSIVGEALCMGRFVDNTILVATNEIGTQQKKNPKCSFIVWLTSRLHGNLSQSLYNIQKIRHDSTHVIRSLLSICIPKQK